MDYKFLFLIVMALPIALLVAAFVYMTYDQDRRGTFIVQLLPEMPLDQVLQEHQKWFHVEVNQSWKSGPASGYRAVIKHRTVKKMLRDGRISSVTETDN